MCCVLCEIRTLQFPVCVLAQPQMQHVAGLGGIHAKIQWFQGCNGTCNDKLFTCKSICIHGRDWCQLHSDSQQRRGGGVTAVSNQTCSCRRHRVLFTMPSISAWQTSETFMNMSSRMARAYRLCQLHCRLALKTPQPAPVPPSHAQLCISCTRTLHINPPLCDRVTQLKLT